jgi:glycosyltransferase involved in cell wall biosynthesis
MPELYRSKFGLEKSHPLIRLITWMERRSVAFAHRALAVHVSHLNALVGHGNPREKFDVLLNLPDPRIFSREKGRSTRSKDGLQLIYHGTMGKLHGLRVALHALSYLHEEIEGVELQLFGDGDDVPHLRALVEELCLRDCVAISHGRVPMESLIPMILGADIGIVPILYDDFTRYMLPTKLLEYVALGIPVICSRTETIEAYFDENMVRYVEPGNARELAAAIADLYRHPRERRRMVANAEKFNRLYSWEQAKNLYYRMMDDLIGKPEVRYEGENHGRGTGRNRETVAPTDRSTPSSHRRRP